MNNEIMVNNYKNPFKHSLFKITTGILNYQFTVNHLNLKPLQINTHTGIILSRKHCLTSFNFDVNEKLIINHEA